MNYRSLEHKIRDLWIAEANRNTEIRRKVANVGRPDDNVKDETSKLAKQGEIKTKIIDEAADGDVGNVVADKKKLKPKTDPVGNKDSDSKKKPKDSDMDDMEAKTIKGGKTEVDTEPKTDDSTENSTDEDQKSKKATNKENKKIGAKGVKEETMTGKLTFGSPQSLINSIAEAMKSMKGICPKCKKAKCMCEGWKEETELEEKLVGGQKKLDKNHNGKLDKQDFKMIRKEEVEELDELSKKTLGSYVKKATDDATDAARRGGVADAKKAPSFAKSAYKTVEKRTAGIAKATDKLTKEEVESIDEGNPANKEKKNAAATAVGAKNRDDKHLGSRGMKTSVADKIRGRQIQKEEVEFSAEELARIEEIANNLDEVVTARKLTAADKAARAKWLAGHNAKMDSYSKHEIKGDAKSFKDRNNETGDYSKEPSKMHKTGLLNTLTKQDTKVTK